VALLDAARSGQCWEGYGLTLTVTKSDALRANVRLAGDLDLASSGVLSAALEHELDSGRRYVRVDLSGLGFIDCTGIEALLEAHWMFLNRRGTLILLGLTRSARRLFELTGVDSVLLIAADHAEIALPVA